MNQSDLKPISDWPEGAQLRIECLECGRNLRRRLCELGLFDGCQLEIIKNDQTGPLIIKIFDSKIALGRGQAAKIHGREIKNKN